MKKNVNRVERRRGFLKNNLGENSALKSGFDNSAKLVKDFRKRNLLKIIGALGLGALIYPLFSKKAQALVFGSAPGASVVGLKDAADARINPAKEDGNLASIKAKIDNIPSDPAKESGKLTTIDTGVGKIPDALSHYKFSDEDTSVSGTVYRGYVDKDGNWFIVKEVITTTTRTYRYAKGTSGYDTATTGAWATRTSQTYDYFHNTF